MARAWHDRRSDGHEVRFHHGIGHPHRRHAGELGRLIDKGDVGVLLHAVVGPHLARRRERREAPLIAAFLAHEREVADAFADRPA
jgi:hypothetical protein